MRPLRPPPPSMDGSVQDWHGSIFGTHTCRVIWDFLIADWCGIAAFVAAAMDFQKLQSQASPQQILAVLENTRPRGIGSWLDLESCLRRIYREVSKSSTVHTYASCLHSFGIVPCLSATGALGVRRAIQLGVDRDRRSLGYSALERPFTQYILSHLQHNSFAQFAAVWSPEPERQSPASVY